VANAEASFVSLQAGSRAGEALQLGIEPMPTVADFADTAYLVDQLDLVITVDTSVGHLAGALGKPVWIITPSIPEYRWLLKRDDSPWYDSARLFRRNAIDDWDGVLSRVSAELDRFINR
jgi:ADP-heptose:LPS heptosyltransferase